MPPLPPIPPRIVVFISELFKMKQESFSFIELILVRPGRFGKML